MGKKPRKLTCFRPRTFPGKKDGQCDSKQVKDQYGNNKDYTGDEKR